MKNKLKKLLRFGLALFTIGFFLANCEKERALEEGIQSTGKEPTFTLKHYSGKNIKKNTGLVSKLKEFNDRLVENRSAKYSGKSSYNKEYDFTIYTDSATYIENGDYHSYTFPLVQDADEKMTNVLFELNDQGGYDAYLVRYDYTANEFNTIDLSSLSLVTSMEPIDLDFDSLSARTKQAYVCVYSYEYVKTGTRFTSGPSNLIEAVYSWVLTAGHCETVLYADEDYTAYHNNNTATVTVSGTTYGGTGGSHTSPIPSPFNAEELMKINVVKSELELNGPQGDWIDKWENGQYAFQLYDFGATNMWSEETKAFSKSAIETLMEGGDADIKNEILKDKSFIDTKADCILKVLTNQTGYFKEVMDAFTNNNSEYKIKFTTGQVQDGADAQTSEPDANGIITITFRPSSANAKDLEVAGLLLHEGAHAQLHRVLASGNRADYNLSTADYNWLLQLNQWWKGESSMPAQTAQHDFMSVRYVNPIANAVRKFDSYTHSSQNYMYFGWEGLYDEASNRGLINMSQFNEFTRLAQVPLTDNHKTSCEQ